MKFSENWLRQLVDIPADRAALAHRLTMSGLEVAGVETIGGSIEGVVVARIVECRPHPDADRLRVCSVDAGAGELQVVCGAPNARVGLVAPLATIGAALPNGITIKAAKLRGAESQGMLCSAKELGIDSDASGLMELPSDAPVGQPLAAYLGLPDAAIEIELTPNRGDCLGMLGLADEVAAEFGTRAKPFGVAPVPPSIGAPRDIRLDAPAACPRYLGRAIRGIDAGVATPAWMARRLHAAGVNTVNAVVDVTNYVMLETGQPLHAFDEAKLAGAIHVRPAREGERLQLLDGSEATLDPSFLLVADDAQPLAAAGVMGGHESRVTDATRDVFLEAAHFAPAAIMGRARKLGIATDAAFRFERGVDPEAPRMAIERATALLVAITGGTPGEIIEAVARDHLPARAAVTLRRVRLARVLGITVPDADVARILAGLGMQVDTRPDGWRATPPTRRFDIEREEDLIEEVARIHGYDAIPAALPAGVPPAPQADETVWPDADLRRALVARDYNEAICYAFVDPRLLEAWQLDAGSVALLNPLSADLATMRTSLLPGLVDALRRNHNRQQARVRLFETGVVFRSRDQGSGTGDREEATARAGAQGGAPVERAMLAAVACGSARAEQWGEPRRALDFHDLKGDLMALVARTGTAGEWSFDASGLPPWLHPGRGARILRDGAAVGAIGELHPALQRALDVPVVHAFEVALESVQKRLIPNAKPLPRFPSIRRDIAIEVDEGVEWAQVETAIRTSLPAIVGRPLLFDCFRGPGLGENRKSLAIGLILQDSSRTLTDADADACVARVLERLESGLGAKLRK